MRVLKITFTLLLSLLIVVFALINSKPIQISYLIGHLELPLSLSLLLSLSLGAFIGMLWTASWVISQRSEAHELSHKVSLLQKEIDNLRALPVKDVERWT